ncbi:MAG TPA: hypothetical protein PLB02_04310 [Thermoanaerobaculia bacterium]|nr:hypothetical protein [Thermoanaerobaculia bacterium]HQR66594.1 hypothetical protein [Thermoanaerobaculia bacterium]
MDSNARAAREFLRHTVATVAYRGGKAIRGAPPAFAEFRPSPTSRSAGEILAHVGDLFDWALNLARGRKVWNDTKPGSWSGDSERLFRALEAFDAFLATDETLATSAEKLFQGPVADALNHVGQIAMLRRMAGAAVKGENYFKADIAAGVVGADQPPPRAEFD